MTQSGTNAMVTVTLMVMGTVEIKNHFIKNFSKRFLNPKKLIIINNFF